MSSKPCNVIIGVEIIIVIIVTEECPAGSTVTTTLTSSSTLQRPIYSTKVEGLPCYPCAVGKPTDGFMTVSYTTCSTDKAAPTVTYKFCHTCEEKTVTTIVPGYTPGAACKSCTDYVSEVPHTHAGETTHAAPTNTYYGGGTTWTSSVRAPVKPTTTVAVVTAGAARNVAGVGAGVLGGLLLAAL